MLDRLTFASGQNTYAQSYLKQATMSQGTAEPRGIDHRLCVLQSSL